MGGGVFWGLFFNPLLKMDWLGILWISQKCLCALCLGSMLFENYIFAAGQPQPYGEFQTVSLQGWRSNPTWLFQKCILPKYKIQPIENSWNILTSSRNGTSVSNSGTDIMWNLGFCLYHMCCVNMSSTFLFCGSDFNRVLVGWDVIPCGEKPSLWKRRSMVAFSFRQHGDNF